MGEEIKSLEKMGTWEAVPLPEGRKTISCKWVYRIKRDADGNPTRYKARLVARGFSQVHGLDYDETYAPVTRLETIRLLLGIAAAKDWEIRQIDVKSAYLYGDLDEEIYMDAPPGYEVPEGYVLHLLKALYGLKQAGRQWYKTLSATLKTFGLVQITNDPHTFKAHRMFNGVRLTIIVPVYVDDFLPMGDKTLVDDFEASLPKSFDVTSSGDASFFLGLSISRDRLEGRRLYIHQYAFIQTILNRFKVKDGPDVPTPLSSTENLVPNTDPIEDVNVETRHRYQSIVGSLMYLMLGSRPDLAYSVGKLARFSSNPSSQHTRALNRVLQYVRTTQNHYLEWIPDEDSIQPEGAVDADFAGDTSDRKSTAGYFFFLGGTVFSWSSKKESTVATSTMEAEYIALFLASQQAAWIFQFYDQIGFPLSQPIDIHCDSEAAINVAKAEQTHKLSKHLDVKCHSIRERVEQGMIKLVWVKTQANSADILTKQVSRESFKTHAYGIGLEDGNYDEEEAEVEAHLTPPEVAEET